MDVSESQTGNFLCHVPRGLYRRGRLLGQRKILSRFVNCPRFAIVRRMKFSVALQTIVLLTCSNTFMTFAWYAHLRNWNDKKWYLAALLSWGIAFFEYQLQVPANRIGYTEMSLSQLKILQEVITLAVFIPFAAFYMNQPLKLDFLWAGLCLVGAVYFMFRA